jgi:hypothetical protein
VPAPLFLFLFSFFSLFFLAREQTMKIGGIDPKTLSNEAVLVLPRGDDKIVFRAVGLKDMDEFTALCPLPKPPGKLTKDGWVAKDDDPTYQQLMLQWGKRRLGYMVSRSLAPSEIEWDTLKLDDSRTWPNWDDDLKNGGLTQIEVNRVLGLVLEANALDEAKLAKAREVFLVGQAPMPAEFSGPATAPASMPSGEPANG